MEEEDQRQDDIIDYTDETKEVGDVEEVNGMEQMEEVKKTEEVEIVEIAEEVSMFETLEEKRIFQPIPMPEELDNNLNVVVIKRPEVHEEAPRPVREPEPLNLRPRREPEEVKPRKGRLTQSIQLMMAYQEMYQ